MSRRRAQNHKPVWKLHTSATTTPCWLFSVSSTTNLVGHNISTSFVDRHKTLASKGLAWWLNKSPCNSGNLHIPAKILTQVATQDWLYASFDGVYTIIFCQCQDPADRSINIRASLATLLLQYMWRSYKKKAETISYIPATPGSCGN